MTIALAQQSLAGLSQTAAHLWAQLTNCQNPEEEAAKLLRICFFCPKALLQGL